MRTRRRVAAFGVVAVLALVPGCGSGSQQDSAQTGGQTSAESPAPNPQTAGSPPVAGFADVVERVSPSVVTVRIDNGVGSGVVLRPDVIVTNAHVVGTARDVALEFADGEQANGVVLATDTVTDLAVVRSSRTGLPVPEYRVELPRPGDWAVAIGSPLGFQNSVTAGVISGLHRDIPGSAAQSQSLVDLIQTDAPISPGNSGGALLDAEGRVVGINEAYIPPAAGAVSLGFAIPSATAIDVSDQLLESGRAAHPYLGVSITQLTPAVRRGLGVAVEDGALVTGVDRGSPAATAGVQSGDVITELDGDTVRSVEDLLSALRRTRPGAQVPMSVHRGNAQQQMTVTIGERAG
ncbi:S1C family serine protease [Mycolicibacterium baixiangningiae]|uniref:S1C family serine protease n=1 Tax=Mycolicibacterium baixiangningiae TaxID=2761578 RepID=UPI0018D066DC|nr:trypsin-like peptidase domain-containing protein [Mycolicibacterium baixiangningiae]